MATIGKYCKAYLLKQLRPCNQFSACLDNETANQLADDDVVYLQENYVVTKGIFQDEDIIFDHVTPDWQDFCRTVLQFEIPIYESISQGAQAYL